MNSQSFFSFLLNEKNKLPEISESSLTEFTSRLDKGFFVGSVLKFNKDEIGALSERDGYFVYNKYNEYKELLKTKSRILKKMAKEKVLTEDAEAKISAFTKKDDVVEFYRRVRQHTTLRSEKATKAGLAPLEAWIWSVAQGQSEASQSPEVEAKKYLNAKEGVLTFSDALKGAESLLAIRLMSQHWLREFCEREFEKKAVLKIEKGRRFRDGDPFAKLLTRTYKVPALYQPINFIPYNKLQKGWREQKVKLVFDFDDSALVDKYIDFALVNKDSIVAPFMKSAVKNLWKNNILPSIVQNFHRRLQNYIQKALFFKFSSSLEKLMCSHKKQEKFVLVMASDGKTDELSLLDETGTFVSGACVDIADTDEARSHVLELLKKLSSEVKVEDLVLQKNTEQFNRLYKFLKPLLKTEDLSLRLHPTYVWGGVELLKVLRTSDETKGLSETNRRALCAGWFFQDPMRGLMEIPLEFLTFGGLTSEQLRENEKKIRNLFAKILFQVGVNINSARVGMLSYLPGFTPELAQAVLTSCKKSPFVDKEHVSRVQGLSSSVFAQCFDFIYIKKAKNKLSETRIPQFMYQPIKDACKEMGVGILKIFENTSEFEKKQKRVTELLGSQSAYDFVLSELKAPHRDPRPEKRPSRFTLCSVSDLEEGGTVVGFINNITTFGLFVDLGLKETFGFIRSGDLFSQGIKSIYKYFTLGSEWSFKITKIDKATGNVVLSLPAHLDRSSRGVKKFSKLSRFKKDGSFEGKKRSFQKNDKALHRKFDKKSKSTKIFQRKEKKVFNNVFAAAFKDLDLSQSSSKQEKK